MGNRIVVAGRILYMPGLVKRYAPMIQVRVANRLCACWHDQKGNRDKQLRKALTREEQDCSHMLLYSGTPAKSLSGFRQIAAQCG